MPEGKLFYIKSQMNGYVLDIQGGASDPGTPVIVWPQKCEDCDNQLWYEDHIEGTLRSKLNGLCLDLNDDNELVLGEFESGRESQQWLTAGDRVQNRANSSRVLDIKGAEPAEGTAVIAYEAHGGENQKWSVEYTEARYFYIHSKMHGKVLDIKGRDETSGSKVVVTDRDEEEQKCQLWFENKYGVILNKANHYVMDSSDSKGKIRLQQYDPGNTNQLWTIQGDRIINRVRPGQVLDIKGEQKKNGAKIISYAWNGNDNQRWEFEYV